MARRFTSSAWITAAGALVFLAFLGLVKPHTFLWDDNLVQFLPWYEFNYHAWMDGQIPQINYYQYLGQTYLSNAQNGFFYPPALVATLLAHWASDPTLEIGWLGWFHLAVAAVVMERLAREMGVTPPWSIAVGWVYLSLPFIQGSAQPWSVQTYSDLYVPLALLQLERLRVKISVARVVQLGLVKALFILGGHINFFAISLLFEALFLFLRIGINRRLAVVLGCWIVGNILAGLGSAPSFGPSLLHVFTSADRNKVLSLQAALDLTMPIQDIPAAQFGLFLHQTYIFQSAWYFLGGAPFYLILAWVYRKNGEIRLCAIMCVTALLFCTDAYYLIHLLPGYHSFRWAGKNVLFAAVFFCLTVGLISEQLKHEWAKVAAFALACSMALNLLVGLGSASNIAIMGRPNQPGLTRFPLQFHLPLAELRTGRSQVLSMRLDSSFDPDYLTYNLATLAQVPALNGYDALVGGQNKREALQVEYIGLPWHTPTSDEIAHLRQWSVRYYLLDTLQTAPPLRPETAVWKKIWQFRTVAIWEDPAALPLAYFEESPQVALPVKIHDNDLLVDIGPASSSPRTLSLAWVPLNGYQCQGRPVPSADSGRMKIIVPPGDSGLVTVSYHEPLLNLFLALGILVWVGGPLISVIFAYVSRQSVDTEK